MVEQGRQSRAETCAVSTYIHMQSYAVDHCGCVCTYLFSECCNMRKRKWGGKLLRRSRMSALTCSLSQHCMHTLLKSQTLPHRGIQANTSACTLYVLSSAVAAASRGDEE